MKRFLMMAAALVLAAAAYAEEFHPKADDKAIVVCGNARFTVLTDRIIRMEWSEDGVFEDNATLAIVNRNLPVPRFKVKKSGSRVEILTDKVRLSYSGKGRFARNNLRVSFSMNGKTVIWFPGADDSGNLKGTTRTLDGCRGYSHVSKDGNELENGILSRDGWAVIDESERHLLVPVKSDWKHWVSERPEGDRQDLYIFAYGHQYTEALADYVKVAGRIPLPPKFTLGYWWSRYWIYTDEEILDLGRQMRERNIPMDVFIIDMDWHETWKELDKRFGRDELGESYGWTGYTWNHRLIPDPDGMLKELHDMGYKTALNLHPASGIRPHEACYRTFVDDYLSRTGEYDGPEGYVYSAEGHKYAGYDKAVGKPGYSAPVPFRLDQQAWADAYFNSVLYPIERQGIDFWWLDWQQWMLSRYVKNLSNTFWCNYVFFNDKLRQGRALGLDAMRPFIYHRWGGLGSHRYQLGFSGDTCDTWEVLYFLPYFTATASNVGYGYWGHDIGGHMHPRGVNGPTNPEVYTRWLQYAVFTPIFKTHSTQSADLDRRIWSYPSHYEYMKAAIELRYALSPYIYDAARYAYDTGVSMCRPLYYYYPEDDKAYEVRDEYLFGDNILATALSSAAGADGRTEKTMWFPGGCDWYDMAHHEMIPGGCEKTLHYTIDENPWYLRAASVVPMCHGLKNLQSITNSLDILVAPGEGECSYTHYEDDGVSQRYADEYAKTLIVNVCDASGQTVTVCPREGSYKGMPSTRRLSFVFEGVPASSSVTVTAAGVECEVKSAFNGKALTVEVPEMPAGKEVKTVLHYGD